MVDDEKKLSPPFSTGGGGTLFENQVQTCFAVLMLSEGICPCLRRPITKIKLQGRYAGYHTDDFIAFVEEKNGSNKAKLLAQIKHNVSITNSNQAFIDAITGAWRDFTNPAVFDPSCDVIVLICGPLSTTDSEHVRPILELARHSATAQEFVDKMGLGNFISDEKRDKLQVFRDQLKTANNGVALSNDELWGFLRRYYLLGYDFDIESGTSLSLIESHIAQFDGGSLPFVWEGVSKAVASANQDAGTLAKDNVPKAVADIFAKPKSAAKMPEELLASETTPAQESNPAILSGDQGDAVMYATLLGSWSDKAAGDMDAAKKLIE
jgi:hypothetical protein